MFQTDISVVHRKLRGTGDPDAVYVMHPFKNAKGPNAGLYEVLRDFKSPTGKPMKRSAHVSDKQLAELMARDLLSALSIRIRVKPADQPYPTSPPAKPIRRVHVRKGSAFDVQIGSIDVSQPMDAAIVSVLGRLGVTWEGA